jgi:hypothetical protein
MCSLTYSSSQLFLFSHISSRTKLFAVPDWLVTGLVFLLLVYLFCFLHVERLLVSTAFGQRGTTTSAAHSPAFVFRDFSDIGRCAA